MFGDLLLRDNLQLLTPICELWTKKPQIGNMMERHLWTKNPLKIRKVDSWECQGASFVDKKSTLIFLKKSEKLDFGNVMERHLWTKNPH